MANDHEEKKEESRGFTIKKKVDESWKNSVEKEKTTIAPQSQAEVPTDQGFVDFLSSLGMQALIFLGLIKNKGEEAPPVHLGQAKYIIDTLRVLQKKTNNNLSAEEAQLLKELIYDLELKFVEISKSQV